MDRINKGRRWARTVVVGVALTSAMSFGTVVATSASAAVTNPNTLCKGHEGVAAVGKGWVACNDGEVFDLSA